MGAVKAKILADSINNKGGRLTTFEIEYPRLVHSEMLTHRMFSRNAHSSRAIPFAKMVENLHGIPVKFNKNQSGMQGGEEWNALVKIGEASYPPMFAWEGAKQSAIRFARAFSDAGYHKQVFNRLVEPFQTMKTIISATEYANWYWLRNDEMADPTIHLLAQMMNEAAANSIPTLLRVGEWHLPYIELQYPIRNTPMWKDVDGKWKPSNWDTLIKVSAARCAAVSFRNEDYGLGRCLEVYARLVGADKKHASALEHQATPVRDEYIDADAYMYGDDYGDSVNVAVFPSTWQVGVTHMDKDENLWSANFKGWIQHRKTIAGENYTGEQ